MEFEQAEREKSKCPYCKKELDRVLYKKRSRGFLFSVNVLCFCPYCKEVLGVGQRRWWME